jgi:hypothetical protein
MEEGNSAVAPFDFALVPAHEAEALSFPVQGYRREWNCLSMVEWRRSKFVWSVWMA